MESPNHPSNHIPVITYQPSIGYLKIGEAVNRGIMTHLADEPLPKGPVTLSPLKSTTSEQPQHSHTWEVPTLLADRHPQNP